MAPDELNAPLGQDKPKKQLKLPFTAPQALAGLLGLCGLIVVGWAALVDDPLGGEPVAVVPTKPSAASAAKSESSGAGTHHARYDGANSGASDAASPVVVKPILSAGANTNNTNNTVTIIDGSSGQRQEVVIPAPEKKSSGKAPTSKPARVDSKLLETTRHGMVAKIGSDGMRPVTRYAQPRQLPGKKKDFPRIAVVVGGIGISASGTADAFSNLPAPVTFALSPYGVDLEKLASHARAEGHELLLQVPMEPFDYPDNDPGPQTLLTSLSADQNVDRLHWLMSRFQGFVGLIGYMGARFVASEQAMGPLLGDAAKRGLLYVDNAASTRSIAGQIAGGRSLPFAKTDVVLDAVPTPAEIDRALARLELLARENGRAVGLATALPSTVARIAEWAKTVENRGFVLVPISMVALKARSS